MKLYLLSFLFLVFTNTHAQSYTLTQTARNMHFGSAADVTVGSDSTVFLANGSGGLRAYSYDGTSFTKTAHILIPTVKPGM